jgi:hypothetical protein
MEAGLQPITPCRAKPLRGHAIVEETTGNSIAQVGDLAAKGFPGRNRYLRSK